MPRSFRKRTLLCLGDYTTSVYRVSTECLLHVRVLLLRHRGQAHGRHQVYAHVL